MMDGFQFDTMIRSLSGSRRSLLGGVLTIAGGWLGVPGAGAKKKRKRKPKQAKPNAFGCLNVDAPCQSAEQCCSGICTGKKGKKRCRAHATGNCRIGQSIAFCGGENSGCALGGGNLTGVCGTSTGNAGYCVGGGDCFPCTRDAECRPFCGPGAACVRCADCTETGGTMCASPGVHTCVFQ
ncbi:MAG: hypothetical protein ACRDJC_24510 [Thermomicrobiales bacterium]